jgi:hypothetical protein
MFLNDGLFDAGAEVRLGLEVGWKLGVSLAGGGGVYVIGLGGVMIWIGEGTIIIGTMV